jgi:hypothetical protein
MTFASRVQANAKVWHAGQRKLYVILSRVFGARIFRPQTIRSPVRDRGRPRRVENVRVLDRKLNLQPFAFVVWIEHDAFVDRAGGAVARFGNRLFGGCFSGIVINQTVTLHEMQGGAVRCAVKVDHGKRSNLEAYRVHDQRIAFIVSDGIARPTGGHLCRMLRI